MYVSIVGVDRLPFGYFRSKLESERVVADSGLPWTTLRTTQFYDLILKGARVAAKLPVVPVPAGRRPVWVGAADLGQPIWDNDAMAAEYVHTDAFRGASITATRCATSRCWKRVR